MFLARPCFTQSTAAVMPMDRNQEIARFLGCHKYSHQSYNSAKRLSRLAFWRLWPNRTVVGLTRQSILFEKTLAKVDGCAGLRLAEAASAAQAGQARA
jgi:hypothetical protein